MYVLLYKDLNIKLYKSVILFGSDLGYIVLLYVYEDLNIKLYKSVILFESEHKRT
jgi:hypothetical protein